MQYVLIKLGFYLTGVGSLHDDRTSFVKKSYNFCASRRVLREWC